MAKHGRRQPKSASSLRIRSIRDQTCNFPVNMFKRHGYPPMGSSLKPLLSSCAGRVGGFVPSFKWNLVVALGIFAILFGAILAPDVSAQTLKLQFGFEDTGTTTTDSVAAVTLNIVNSAGTAADLHGAAGSGVAGVGKALDFTSAPGSQAAGPLASATNNASLGFGSVSTWTVTEWIKPVTGANLATVLSRLFILGTNGTVNDAAANSIGTEMENNGLAVRMSINSGNRMSVGLTPPLALNTWSFIAYTYDGATLKMYSGSESVSPTHIAS